MLGEVGLALFLLARPTPLSDSGGLPPEGPDSWDVRAHHIRKRLKIGEIDRRQALRLFVDEVGIPGAAADPFLRAQELEEALNRTRPADMSEGRLRPLQKALEDMVRAAPLARPTLELATRQVCRAEVERGDKRELTRSWIRLVKDHSRLALAFARSCRESELTRRAFAEALRERPDDPVLIASLADSLPDSPWEPALHEAALQAMQRRTQAPADAVDLLVHRALTSFARLSLSAPMVEILDALPGDAQARLLARQDARTVESEVDGLPIAGKLDDLRLTIAAAYALEGQSGKARRIRDSIPPVDRVPPRMPRNGELVDWSGHDRQARLARQWRAVNLSLDPPADPFETLAATLDGDRQGDLLWNRLVARFAERQGYQEVTAYLAGLYSPLGDVRPLDQDPLPFLADRIGARARLLANEISRLTQWRSALAVRAMAPTRRVGVEVRIHAAVIAAAAELSGPRFRQMQPDAVPPSDPSGDQLRDHFQSVRAALPWPAGFGVIRYQRLADAIAALATSQARDPTGEVSAGGYWLLISHDGGQEWLKLHTGLRASDPYLVRPLSELPILDAGQVRIDAVLREVDRSSITFPPLFMRAAREQRGVVLTMALADLERDSDGDSLTDVEEGTLFTDPKHQDTDGDGQADGLDDQPHVPARAVTPSRRALAVAAVMGHLQRPEGESLAKRVWRALWPAEEQGSVGFLVFPRADLAGVRLVQRAVVLDPDEAQTIRARRLAFSAVEFDLLLLDPAQRRGLVVWSARWRGGTLRLDWRLGAWRVRTLSAWIT